MKKTNVIQIEEFCTYHNVERSFIHQLWEYEVLSLHKGADAEVIDTDELPKLEKMVRLHQELEINPQGLQAIYHLLEKVDGMQKEILSLRRRLDRFDR